MASGYVSQRSTVTSSRMVIVGRVSEFDAHRGLGRVVSDSGESYLFHCVEIGDGSRSIEVGTKVEFEVREKFSRPEAFSVRAV